MNTILLKKLIDGYNSISYTHNYLFGFSDRGTVYCAKATADILPYVCIVDMASRNGGASLRYKPTVKQKELLKTYELIPICSTKLLEDTAEATCYNRGEIFEKFVTEYYGQHWTKDHVPFTDAGDIEVDGVAYQIKYEKATFVSEKTLQKLLARH